MNQVIENHIKNYYSKLGTRQPIKVSEFFDTFKKMKPLLHKLADTNKIDSSAINYSSTRLPDIIDHVKHIVIGHHKDDFKKAYYPISTWQKSFSTNRRRRMYYSEKLNTLACLVTSDSDIDDLVNSLISYQIEKLKSSKNVYDIDIHLLDRTDSGFYDISKNWWREILSRSLVFGLDKVPLYFVFSNLHSISNIISGYVRQKQNEIFNYAESAYPEILKQWQEIKEKNILRVNDFLYFISSKYFADNPEFQKERDIFEEKLGIKKIKIEGDLYCDANLIPVSSIINSSFIDPYLSIKDKEKLKSSDAYIVNIDYPLGFAAYYLLSEILSNGLKVKGVYVQGKAGILSGEIGDVQIPKTVYDERTNNTFNFDNIFNTNFPQNTFKSKILKDLKAVSVFSTYLENKEQMDSYVKDNFNIIEMESGPYLLALAKKFHNFSSRPLNQNFDKINTPFEIGIINYASDNPLVQTLGEGQMGMKGIEPTYLASLSIVQRIIENETSDKT